MREFNFNLEAFNTKTKRNLILSEGEDISDSDLKKRKMEVEEEYNDITGKLILCIPKYRQRLMMIKECNFQVGEEGTVNINSKAIESMVKLLDVAKPHFKKIDLKCGDIHVKNFDDMESYSEFDALLTEAASSILNAGKLGK